MVESHISPQNGSRDSSVDNEEVEIFVSSIPLRLVPLWEVRGIGSDEDESAAALEMDWTLAGVRLVALTSAIAEAGWCRRMGSRFTAVPGSCPPPVVVEAPPPLVDLPVVGVRGGISPPPLPPPPPLLLLCLVTEGVEAQAVLVTVGGTPRSCMLPLMSLLWEWWEADSAALGETAG